ncbi:MAG: hypothetical protein GY719_18785 [bacterium]|nr:hypothetical protein [bacterium]
MISRILQDQGRFLFLVPLLISLFVILGHAEAAYSVEFCEPGKHFVDRCTSGDNYVEGKLVIGIDTVLDGILDGVADFDSAFVGYVRIVRDNPLDDSLHFPGYRAVDGHSGVIGLEMASMRSTGVKGTPTEGWTIRTGRNSGVYPSTLGAVAECEPGKADCVKHTGDPEWALSIFHMFFEIDVPTLGTLRNYNPALPDNNVFMIGTEIDRAPPALGTRFFPIRPVTAVFDENGVHVASLVAALTTDRATTPSGSTSHAKNLVSNLRPGGKEGDGRMSLVYDAATGEVRIDIPVGLAVNSINIDSASGIFGGAPARNLGENPDNNHTDDNIVKSVSYGSFGSTSFGSVARRGLSERFLLSDLRVVGSLTDGAGAFGDLDLVYIPEAASKFGTRPR